MSALLSISRLIDAFTDRLGRTLMWLVLLTTLISAGNAIVRKLLNTSSNAFLEIQWYLFAAVFMLGSGYAFLKNAHVRIDFIASKFGPKGRNWVDVIGILVFVFPLCYMMVTLSWPVFENAWESGEMSSNAGGLIRWPVYFLIPAGFVMLALQSCSELIKRIAFLVGAGPDVLGHGEAVQDMSPASEGAAKADAAKGN